jgi:hypothetical protein
MSDKTTQSFVNGDESRQGPTGGDFAGRYGPNDLDRISQNKGPSLKQGAASSQGDKSTRTSDHRGLHPIGCGAPYCQSMFIGLGGAQV